MRQYTRSVERRIVRKNIGPGEAVVSAEAVPASGSRVYYLRNPPEKRMPTFRRRPSTRTFVRKREIADKELGELNNLTRFLQSGKNLCLSEPVEKTEFINAGDIADIRWLETNGNEECKLSEPFLPVSAGNEMATLKAQGLKKMFVNVYKRKRPRNPSWDDLHSSSYCGGGQPADPRFKVFFSRKPKKMKPNVTNDLGEVRGHHFGEAENLFRPELTHGRLQFRKMKINNDEDELSTSFWDPLLLVVLSESSCDVSLLRFGRFLISVISWMTRTRMNLNYFTAFLLSEPMDNAFLHHGIRFLPVADKKRNMLIWSSLSNYGICAIYSSCKFLPLISLNFLALPSYFKSLHLDALLWTRYLHFPHSVYFMASNMKPNPDIQCEDCDSHVQLEIDFSGTMFSAPVSASLNKEAPTHAQASAIVARSTGILRGARLRKLQRKRSLKHSNFCKFSSRNSRRASFASQNGAILSLPARSHVRQPENSVRNPLIFYRNKPMSTSRVTHSELTEVSKKNRGGQMKEIKAALSDIKENIDSVQCNANIIVIAGDRCWREEDAVVSLELSSSGEWCLAVKIGSSLRRLHRPQDMKYTLNRFTHAHMWIVEDGWRLEFPEKLDWLTFKELHTECRQRNNPHEDASVKFIPVPVFKEVSTYEDDTVSGFERPEQYIRMKHDDENLRVSVSQSSYYDIDSEDEEWLQKHNCSRSTLENDSCSYLSEDTFERMMFTFEKNAFYSSNVIFSEREPNGNEDLGSKDTVADVYDYWLKKRKKKCGPLVRVFQGLSLKKPLLIQRQVLRKRRSLKKQRSQVGRGTPACLFNSKAKQEAKAEALVKVQEAENAWRRATEAAVPLRHRAQLLMENADLAAYKSVMALRIAEAVGSMPADDLSSSLLDQLPEEA